MKCFNCQKEMGKRAEVRCVVNYKTNRPYKSFIIKVNLCVDCTYKHDTIIKRLADVEIARQKNEIEKEKAN